MLLPYEYIPVVIGVVFVFGLIAFGLLRKSLADKERLQLREMLHRERMAALEKNLPLDEIKMESALMATAALEPTRGDSIAWIRLTALFLGLAFFFGGIGMCLAFRLAPEVDFNDIWTLGMIPALTGMGLLLFYYLTTGPARGEGAA